jgi:peptidoglycan/LPS O-acetylase OafA/YrhL
MKFRYLDGLRGLAALVVVIDHFAISFFQAATDASVHPTHGILETAVQKTPLHLIVSGNFSVCVFFILSGIVLSSKFFHTGDSKVVTASAIKRYPRLALPVIGCVLLAFTLMSLHAFFNVPASRITGSTWLVGFWRFHPNLFNAIYQGAVGIFIKGASTYNTVLWTMKIELIGSFVVFALLLLVGKLRYRYFVYLLLGLLFIQTYYVTFVLGIALCDRYYHRRTAPKASWHWAAWVPLLVASLGLASVPIGTLNGTWFAFAGNLLPAGASVPDTAHIIGAFGLVMAILYTPTLQNLLIKKPVLYLGKISFSLYLTHLYIIGSFSSYLFAQVEPSTGYGLGFVIMIIPSALLIWLVADLFTRLVDEPAIRLAAKLRRGWPSTHRLSKSLRLPL